MDAPIISSSLPKILNTSLMRIARLPIFEQFILLSRYYPTSNINHYLMRKMAFREKFIFNAIFSMQGL